MKIHWMGLTTDWKLWKKKISEATEIETIQNKIWTVKTPKQEKTEAK